MQRHLRLCFDSSSQGRSSFFERLFLFPARSSSALAVPRSYSHFRGKEVRHPKTLPKEIVSLVKWHTLSQPCLVGQVGNPSLTELSVWLLHRRLASVVSRGYFNKSEKETAAQSRLGNVFERKKSSRSEDTTSPQSTLGDREKETSHIGLDDECGRGEFRASDVNDLFEQEMSPQVALKIFLERTEHIVRISSLLSEWNDDTLDALTELELRYDTTIVTQVLRSLGELGRQTTGSQAIDAALGFFNWLRSQEGFKHDEYTYGVMLNGLGKAGRTEEMQALYEEMRREGCPLTIVTRSKVMFWLGRAKKFGEVVRLWKQMEEEGVKPTVSTYTVMIDSLARAKQYRKVINIYKEMLKKECLPNARTHTVLIEHLVDAGKVEDAFEILGIMENMKVVPNKVTYEALIVAYAKTGNMEMVTKLVAAMKERFLRPGIRLAVAVRALQDAGKLEEANMLAKDIWPKLAEDSRIADEFFATVGKEVGYTNDEDDYETDVPDVWRADGGLNAGLDLNALALILKNWNPSVEEVIGRANIKWSSLLAYEILRRVRDQDAAWNFFRFLREKPGFKHDSYSCMFMMQRILKGKSNLVLKANLVEELLIEAFREGLLSVPLVNMVIRYYVGRGEIEAALKKFDSIREFDLEPNEASYTAIIKGLACDRQGKKAMDLFEEMQQANLKPSSQVYTELIKCLGLADKYENAYSLFRKMVRSGIKMGSDEYMAIISMYNRLGDHKRALSLYEEMRSAGIRPAQRAGSYEVVKTILHRANRITDLLALAKKRDSLDLFEGSKKRLQESLLTVISVFSTNFVKEKTRSTFRNYA